MVSGTKEDAVIKVSVPAGPQIKKRGLMPARERKWAEMDEDQVPFGRQNLLEIFGPAEVKELFVIAKESFHVLNTFYSSDPENQS